MVVPDFELICEIMLVAEGFLEARLLARKFITLYTLCKELLSKQVCGAGSWAQSQVCQGFHTGGPGGRPDGAGEASARPSSRPASVQTSLTPDPRPTWGWALPAGQPGRPAHLRTSPCRTIMTGACELSSLCWWWPVP